jgi:hypothetical protein
VKDTVHMYLMYWGTMLTPTIILQILRISKQDHTLDLVLGSSAQTRHRIRHDCGALRVTTSRDGYTRALSSGEVEEALGFSDGDSRGTRWQGILCISGSVGATHALDPDLGGAVSGIEGVGHEWTDHGALYQSVSLSNV